MSEIDDVFLEALLFFLAQEKSQKDFATIIGVSPPYLNDLIMKRRSPEERTKRRIAAALGYGDDYYEDFMNVGRVFLSRDSGLLSDESIAKRAALRASCVLLVERSPHMFIGANGEIAKSYGPVERPAVVFGPDLRRSTADNLKAFTFTEDNMEKAILKDSTIIVDLTVKELDYTKEKPMYLVCLDRGMKKCTVKYISVSDLEDKVIVTAEDPKFRPMLCDMKDIVIVGRVLMVYVSLDYRIL
ncbi:MAG: helix-turn-helix transcriptional regulator [Deltaproteobacteria bacterium]|jgi:transcriptional regulator with XRE-family HTH domain|nr:helix-turn-helix transcriptional regulator [Deltaproteobacteria bacterium]